MAKGNSKKKSPPAPKCGGSMAAEVGEGEETRTLLVRSEDGMDFVVSDLEARQSMVLDAETICYDGEPICVDVDGETLSKVLHYCKKHAAAGDDDDLLRAWDAKFVRDLDHDTLCNVILAADSLCVQGLLRLTCNTVAKMIKGKSCHEICDIFNLWNYLTHVKKKMHLLKNVNMVHGRSELEDPNLDRNRALRLEENALRAIHIGRCQEFTEYDPKQDFFVCSRLSDPNIAFFDLDKESRISRGPPLDGITGPLSDWGLQSLVNIISFKVAESEVGYNFSVFGTVIARDEVHYKCLYLFRRGKDDAQIISSPVCTRISLVFGLHDDSIVRSLLHILPPGDSGRAAGGPVALARHVVAVPVDKKVVVSLVSLTDECSYVDGLTEECEEGKDAFITLRPSYQGRVYKMGWGQVQVQVVWTAVPKSNKYKMDVVGNVMLLH
ncbi:uncharacterized protein [Triticum aestivum]|uniref:uncharacterized protein n=1 Tax=Triticum aestivum TaxID=4565 RepID=UPI001D020DB0|nr:uncharacterized protein LOC123191953 [Triticum aestivum]